MGLEGKDLSADIQACVTADMPVVTDMQTALSDFEEKSLSG